MNNQKIENLLNLSIDATAEERIRSGILETGYDSEENTWQVIVRYHGDLKAKTRPEWDVTILRGGYAIIQLAQSEVERLSDIPEIEYIEKPKRLFFSVDQGRAASCISAVQNVPYQLTGKGVLVAVIDSGVDYFHPDFRKDDGSTRIIALWDQSAKTEGNPPTGFRIGAEYSKDDIDRALNMGNRESGLLIVPEQDLSGHGTEVLGIAAGNGRSSGRRYRGIASESELLVVKLGISAEDQFPRTTELMQALEYVIRKAEELDRPLAVNLSFGNVYGSHRGNSLLEDYINMLAGQGRTVISVGTGNEGNAAGHAGGKLSGNEIMVQEFIVDSFETTLNIQLWKNYVDEFEVYLIHPNRKRIGPLSRELGTARYRLGTLTILMYYGEPTPYQEQQEIFIDFLPDEEYVDRGIWSFELVPRYIVNGQYDLWMNESRTRNSGTRFLTPSPDATLTIPATAEKIIAVGAYNSRTGAYASFSGRGWNSILDPIRPDLAAPGVDIVTTAVGGGYVSVQGTSFATPFVTGAAALLMEWGIVQGNDPYLYGEKVRAYLQKGARQLPGYEIWPNNEVGYGALCVKNSLPD